MANAKSNSGGGGRTALKILGTRPAIAVLAGLIGFSVGAVGGNEEPQVAATPAPQTIISTALATKTATMTATETAQVEVTQTALVTVTATPSPQGLVAKTEARATTTEIAAIAAEPSEEENVYYENCAAARAAGAAPVRRGDPGYARHLDRDDDGIGCE